MCFARRAPELVKRLGQVSSRWLSTSKRAWHEPRVLFPSTQAFRETELGVLAEFVEVCEAGVDALPNEATAAVGEAVVRSALKAAAGAPCRVEALLGGLAERYATAEAEAVGDWTASTVEAATAVRLALGRRHATHMATILLPAEAARNVARRGGAPDEISWWPVGSSRAESERHFTEAFERKLEMVLAATTRGDLAARLEAHFMLEDNDDDGLIDEAAATRVIEALALPVGPALADAHDRLVSKRLPGRPVRRSRRQKVDARRHLATAYPRYRLDIKSKARCVAAWADKSKTDELRPPPPILSADWLLGRGPQSKAYLDKDQLASAVKQFSPDLLKLGRASAADLLDRRTEYWNAVEENRTSQYAVAAFCVFCGVIDYGIMVA